MADHVSWLLSDMAGFTIAAAVCVVAASALFAAFWCSDRKESPGRPIPSLSAFELSALPWIDLRGVLAKVQSFLSDNNGVFKFATPLGKPFIVVSNPIILEDILHRHSSRYKKQHANGILEIFRKTTLPVSKGPAWVPVHQMAGRFGKHTEELDLLLQPLVDKLCNAILNGATSSSPTTSDVGEAVCDFYWRVTLAIVLGDDVDDDLPPLYEEAWKCCITQLQSPLVNAFAFYKYLPIPSMLRYRDRAERLRAIITSKMAAGRGKSPWSIRSMMFDKPDLAALDPADKAEVALEFMFTGTTSVTSTMSWMIWHIAAAQSSLQADLVKEVEAKAALSGSLASKHSDANGRPHVKIGGGAGKSGAMPIMDAVIRETLRMYSPIHVGRWCPEGDTAGGYAIPPGADIMTNMWFRHRSTEFGWEDPDTFNINRWMQTGSSVTGGASAHPNKEHYHPFSIGPRGCPGQSVAFMISRYVVGSMLMQVKLEVDPSCEEPDFKPMIVLPNTPRNMLLKCSPR